jgi:hypothetical protein
LDTTETENSLELKTEEEEKKFQRTAIVHNILEMWQVSQILCPTQKESCAQNQQISATGYNANIKEIIKASWSNFQFRGVAAFKLSG